MYIEELEVFGDLCLDVFVEGLGLEEFLFDRLGGLLHHGHLHKRSIGR